MSRVNVEGAYQRRDEEVPVLVRDGRVATSEALGGVIHGFHAIGQQVLGAAGVDQGPDSMSEVRRGILVFALQEGIDDRTVGILMTDAVPAFSFDHVQVLALRN